MQDKKLDDMTKKYKEEMMRLYSKNRTANSASPPRAVPQPETAGIREKAVTVRPSEKPAPTPQSAPTSWSAQPVHRLPVSPPDNNGRQNKKVLSEEALSHPPMPEIPKNYVSAESHTESSSSAKFPSPEEILKRETSGTDAVPAAVKEVPEPRFAPAEEHNQGNYDFSPVQGTDGSGDIDADMQEEIQPNVSYPDENTDFSAVDQNGDFPEDNPSDMSGQGYLQVEATTASRAVPVRDATVVVTEMSDGKEALIGMLITDENGATPVIPLSAPSRTLSESPDPSERPYSEYNIKVYKQGFYTVPLLTVPIFDGIKSIQPVSMIPLAEFELEGAGEPNETR